MSRFDPNNSILAGMDDTVLRARLGALQSVYLDLSSGAKISTASYAMGDGAKTVTYEKADMGALVQAIRLLQTQLGDVIHGRRALGVRF